MEGSVPNRIYICTRFPLRDFPMSTSRLIGEQEGFHVRSAAEILTQSHVVGVSASRFSHPIPGILRRNKDRGSIPPTLRRIRRLCKANRRRRLAQLFTGVPGFCEAIMTAHLSVRSDRHGTNRVDRARKRGMAKYVPWGIRTRELKKGM